MIMTAVILFLIYLKKKKKKKNQSFSRFFVSLIIMNESIVYITIIVILEYVGCPEKGMLL